MRAAERWVAAGTVWGADGRGGPPRGGREREGVVGGVEVAEDQQDRADEEGDGPDDGEGHRRRLADEAGGPHQGAEFAAALPPGTLAQGTDLASAAAEFVLGLSEEVVD
ncbi:hypothetical protein [Streptomyces sp. NPDC052721]|uniref:hypothetical protein n=1 Tax=Streptomyces sp. NPDC052721 TaxID=3154955 RepID=UPI00341A3C9E